MNSIMIKAILAMDSYNRGYNAGIKFGTFAEPNYSLDSQGIKIGNAIIYDTKGDGEARKIGFYAIAYDLDGLPGGETVISYRGTDSLGLDTLTGYGVGAGNPKESQAQMAFRFYQSVAGEGIDPRTANISLTGHSLGGGLAGLVGSVYNKSGVLFDNMAFEGAANNTKLFSLPSSGSLYNAAFKETVYGSRTPWDPTISSSQSSPLQTYYVDGEFLGFNRSAQSTPQNVIDIGTSVNLPGIDSGIVGGNLHSMATLTILLYADARGGMNIASDWKGASRYFWPVLYNNEFAKNFGNYDNTLGTMRDNNKYSSIVLTALAYSAIDEGTRIFGDTGIVALYNDANDLGRALGTANSAATLSAYATDFSKIFVEFAGRLALNKVSQGTAGTAVLNGVLTHNAAGSTLVADLTDATWQKAGGTNIWAGRDALYQTFIAQNPQDASVIQGALTSHWGSQTNGAAHFDRIAVTTRDSGATSLSDGGTKATLFIGGIGSDIMTGSMGNDLIAGGRGTDTLIGGKGRDILAGGSGADTADYSKDAARGGAGAITVNAQTNTVIDGWGDTDKLLSIEKIILSSKNDTVNTSQTAMSQFRTYDGGAGTDTAAYAYSSVPVIIDRREMAQGTQTVWSKNGQYADTYINFENITYSTIAGSPTAILPDMRQSNLVLRADLESLDYSAMKSSGSFDVGSFMDFENKITVGGFTQNITAFFGGKSTPLTIRGTNYGDYFHVAVSYGAAMTVYTGSGNDTIDNPPSAGPDSAAASYLTIVYGGGVDTIKNAYCIDTVRVWAGLRYQDVTGVSYNWSPGDYGSATVNFINGQSIKLDNLIIDGVNNEAVWRSNYLDRLTFDSGGYIQFLNGGGWTYVAGAPLVAELTGTWGDDVLKSFEGQTVYAMGGNDVLEGSASNDTLYGGAGNDTLRGGAGVNKLYGGEGDDIFILAGGSSNQILDQATPGSDRIIFSDINRSQITVSAGLNEFFGPNGFYLLIADISTIQNLQFANGQVVALNDFLIIPPIVGTNVSETVDVSAYASSYTMNLMAGDDAFIGSAYNDTVNGGDGNDIIEGRAGNDILNGDAGIDTVSYAAASSGVTVSLAITTAQNTIGAGTDTLTGFENLTGSAFNDVLRGNSGANVINGGDGDDWIDGGAGSDSLHGGAGTDIVSFSAATTRVTVDLSNTQNQSSTLGLYKMSGFEHVIGSAYNDTIYGGMESNTLEGGRGIDYLSGGQGDDIYVFRPGDSPGIERIEEYNNGGHDTIKLTGGILPSAVRMWFDDSGKVNVQYTTLDTISFDWFNFDENGVITGSHKIEQIVFDDGTVWDLTQGYRLVYTDSDESIQGSPLPDIIEARGGNDSISSNAGDDKVYGGSGDDTISAWEGNDELYGEAGNDYLYGGDGNDTLDGGLGSDMLLGDAGDDTYIFRVGDSPLSSRDIVTDHAGEGIDTIRLVGGILPSAVTYKRSGDNLLLKYSATDEIILSGWKLTADGTAWQATTSQAERIVFDNGTVWNIADLYASTYKVTAGNDTVNASAATSGVTIDLLAGNDTFTGSNFNDNVIGGNGNDIIEGRGGNDTLNGGAGTDTLTYVSATTGVTLNLSLTTAQNTGGAGTDTISAFENLTGSAYNDILTGTSGANVIDGGNGDDRIDGGAGNDTLKGGAGIDTLSYAATTGAVTVNLSTTTAQATGGAGSDTITGFENIIGGSGADTLRGTTGANDMRGGNGNDTIYGNSGNDTLYGDAGTDTLYGDAGNDVLWGGAGADNLYGGAGADTFKFDVASLGAIDKIKDFKTAESDKLDLKDILIGYNATTKAITDYIQITTSGANSILKVDRDGKGTAYGWTQIATIEAATGLTDELALKNQGRIIV